MILNSTPDLKKHVSVGESFVFDDLQPYVSQAVDEFTSKYVGELDEILADEATEGDNVVKLNKARHYLQAALSNFSLYLYTPVGTINIDGTGMTNTVTDHRTPLTYGEKRDVQRTFLSAGHKSMDRLLAYMEKNKTAFPEWEASTQYTESKKLLVNNTAIFNAIYNIYESRQTYLALQPSIRQVEDQYIRTFLCPELINFLKTGEPTDAQLEVKEFLQKAVVAYTIAKVANEGIFTIDASSLMLKFNVLSDDKPVPVPELWLNNTIATHKANGDSYLKMVSDIITKNIEQFNQCAAPIIVADSPGGYQAIVTQSVIGI